ncbi:hypothetical protein [Coleofasciculus sp. E1-EBD-02]|uniref:hypothetical protein n=1 Tax=Coleofasciculus sp. E1-EBD-02 TaxID=3068481 RepID=UPI0032FB7CB9
MPLDCTGESLPDIPEIESQENPNSLDDFCLILNTNDQVIFYENLSGANYKYWMILEADDYPLTACDLEKYADYASQNNQWLGRRADYLIIGSHQGDCYLVVVELRQVLVKTKQEDDKFEQLRQSIKQIIEHLEIISNSTSLEAVYINPSSYKIIGVLIAPANTRSFSRGELNPIVAINSHKVLIRTLPKNALSDCKITWTDLLQRIGLPPNHRAGTSNPEFDIPVTHTPS